MHLSSRSTNFSRVNGFENSLSLDSLQELIFAPRFFLLLIFIFERIGIRLETYVVFLKSNAFIEHFHRREISRRKKKIIHTLIG